jgi:nicotinamide-nucleotide amidase
MTANTLQLAVQLGQLLLTRHWQISCAESCTGGGIGYAITAISGSSAWFKQGIISYANDAKEKLLNVDAQILATYGAVSQQTVEAMAQGAAMLAKAQVAVAVSGIAGPDGGSVEKPVGTVWFGFFIDGEVSSNCQLFTGDRQSVREQAVDFALQQTRHLIEKQ